MTPLFLVGLNGAAVSLGDVKAFTVDRCENSFAVIAVLGDDNRVDLFTGSSGDCHKNMNELTGKFKEMGMLV